MTNRINKRVCQIFQRDRVAQEQIACIKAGILSGNYRYWYQIYWECVSVIQTVIIANKINKYEVHWENISDMASNLRGSLQRTVGPNRLA